MPRMSTLLDIISKSIDNAQTEWETVNVDHRLCEVTIKQNRTIQFPPKKETLCRE